jgi:gas vesicle protein
MYSEFDSGNQSSSNLSFVAGLFTGAVIGAGVGLLFAPRAGSEMRGRLVDSASAMGRKMSETMDAVADAGRDAYQQARDVAATAGDELKSAAGDVSSGVNKGAAAIRNAAAAARGRRQEFTPHT